MRSERFDAGTTSERDANGISRRRCRGGASAEEQSGGGGFAEKPETAGSTGLQEGGDRGARGRDGAAREGRGDATRGRSCEGDGRGGRAGHGRRVGEEMPLQARSAEEERGGLRESTRALV